MEAPPRRLAPRGAGGRVAEVGMWRRFQKRFSLPPAVRRDCSRLEHAFYDLSASVLLHDI